ncbi:hypothetical protein NMY22_g17161 [Coprinellus aureogranulatus]|nr:hypothetical protein NMY22_g17161 [Coprinellus aureogranulatus]
MARVFVLFTPYPECYTASLLYKPSHFNPRVKGHAAAALRQPLLLDEQGQNILGRTQESASISNAVQSLTGRLTLYPTQGVLAVPVPVPVPVPEPSPRPHPIDDESFAMTHPGRVETTGAYHFSSSTPDAKLPSSNPVRLPQSPPPSPLSYAALPNLVKANPDPPQPRQPLELTPTLSTTIVHPPLRLHRGPRLSYSPSLPMETDGRLPSYQRGGHPYIPRQFDGLKGG